MRICAGLLCDNAADLWWHREAWCARCANQRFGASVGVIAALELRDPPSTRPDGAGRPTRPHRSGEAAVEDFPSSAAAPAPLSDGDVETLLARHGWDLMDLEWALVAHLEEP